MVPINSKEIEGAVVEIVEIDAGRVVGMHAGMVTQDVFHNGFGLVNFFERGLVGDTDVKDASDMGALGDVPDRFVREFAIRDGNKVSIKGADTGGAQANGFYGAIMAVDIDAVPDFKRFIDQQHNRSKEVT